MQCLWMRLPGMVPDSYIKKGRIFLFMVLGITGSIGAGKSTVREEFSALGWRFFDADSICHDIYASPEGEFFNGIISFFGEDVLSGTGGGGPKCDAGFEKDLKKASQRQVPDAEQSHRTGMIDRKKLAAKVFGQPEKLQQLTALLYPELNRRLDAAISACREENVHGAFEIPLLYENDYQKKFDAVLTVWSAAEIRYKRLVEMRHFTRDDIVKREKEQLPPDEKLSRADFALINNGSRELLHEQIIFFINRFK